MYGSHPRDFNHGDRVELHPANDWWMRGARYGTVISVNNNFVYVKLDATGAKPKRFAPRDLKKL